MNIKGLEAIRPSLAELAEYDQEYFSEEDRHWNMANRVKLAKDLYDFLTAGSTEKDPGLSFVKAYGKKDILWKAGFWNIGTNEIPILWGLEGCGDERGVRIQVFIPLTLAHELDELYHGEREGKMMPWQDNIISTVGFGGTGLIPTFMIDGKEVRFFGTDLSREEFVDFAIFGSGSRLLAIVRSVTHQLGI